MSENRCALARRRAGLSVAQAARLLSWSPTFVDTLEGSDVDDIFIDDAKKMADCYRCSVEWLLGKVERYDRARARAIPGADKLHPQDFDAVAELIASLPRQTETVAERIARVETARAGQPYSVGTCAGCEKYSMMLLLSKHDDLRCGTCRRLA